MKIKVQRLMDTMLIVSNIINEQRPMPQKGKYRLSRLHAKVLPEFVTINAQRDALIRAYNTHQKIRGLDGTEIDGPEFTVPQDKIEEFNAAWAKIAEEEIEVDIEPIPLAQIDLGDAVDGSITAQELSILGDLVVE